jgi:antitoxin (DNA-binding transcriptional repressor) of toxin-antitoxin stability system
MTMQVKIAEFEANPAHYLSEVEKGNEIVVVRGDVPVAEVKRIGSTPKKERVKAGFMKGTMKILGPVDEPLIPEEYWEMYK